MLALYEVQAPLEYNLVPHWDCISAHKSSGATGVRSSPTARTVLGGGGAPGTAGGGPEGQLVQVVQVVHQQLLLLTRTVRI